MQVTLANIQSASLQEIFDHVADHLIKQNRKCTTSSGFCVWRRELEDGTIVKCAVGSLIADEEFTKRMDAYGEWKSLYDEGLVPHVSEETHKLLNLLQEIHDMRDTADWPEFLSKAAEKFDLQYAA